MNSTKATKQIVHKITRTFRLNQPKHILLLILRYWLATQINGPDPMFCRADASSAQSPSTPRPRSRGPQQPLDSTRITLMTWETLYVGAPAERLGRSHATREAPPHMFLVPPVAFPLPLSLSLQVRGPCPLVFVRLARKQIIFISIFYTKQSKHPKG